MTNQTNSQHRPGRTSRAARAQRASRNGSPRSVRVDDQLWEQARHRAEQEGRSMSGVMVLLLEGYARNLIHPPEAQLVFRQADAPSTRPTSRTQTTGAVAAAEVAGQH